jgi:hypothetical protein
MTKATALKNFLKDQDTERIPDSVIETLVAGTVEEIESAKHHYRTGSQANVITEQLKLEGISPYKALQVLYDVSIALTSGLTIPEEDLDLPNFARIAAEDWVPKAYSYVQELLSDLGVLNLGVTYNPQLHFNQHPGRAKAYMTKLIDACLESTISNRKEIREFVKMSRTSERETLHSKELLKISEDVISGNLRNLIQQRLLAELNDTSGGNIHTNRIHLTVSTLNVEAAFFIQDVSFTKLAAKILIDTSGNIKFEF